jgi:aminoglycoside phosphotransferase family enzyme
MNIIESVQPHYLFKRVKEQKKYSDFVVRCRKTLRRLLNPLLVQLSELTGYQLVLRFSPMSVAYPIEDEDILASPATMIIFPRSLNGGREQICLKMWQPCINGVYNTLDKCNRLQFLTEGINFNARLARDVYLGIAPVSIGKNAIWIGKLIKEPGGKMLSPNREYALVMKRLDEAWRLDHQLTQGLSSREGMEFLAREIARIHNSLDPSPADKGDTASITTKVALNMELFAQALTCLKNISTGSPVIDIESYRLVERSMKRAVGVLKEYFEFRRSKGHIRRCHGDLKATNLWVLPPTKHTSQQLLALDCVDFNPTFCHIDTLSDVAMLLIDIETRLKGFGEQSQQKFLPENCVQQFLIAYLETMKEKRNDKVVKALLEFYMTEKAVICAYMNILYDGLPTAGIGYLNTALRHAQQLKIYVNEIEKTVQSSSHRGSKANKSFKLKPLSMVQ